MARSEPDFKQEISLATLAAGLAQIGASGFSGSMVAATVGTFFLVLLPALLRKARTADDGLNAEAFSEALSEVQAELELHRKEYNLTQAQFKDFCDQFQALAESVTRLDGKTDLLRRVAARHSAKFKKFEKDIKDLFTALGELRDEFVRRGVPQATADGIVAGGLETQLDLADLYGYLSGEPNLQGELSAICLFISEKSKNNAFRRTSLRGESELDRFRSLLESLQEHRALNLLFEYLKTRRPEIYRDLFGINTVAGDGSGRESAKPKPEIEAYSRRLEEVIRSSRIFIGRQEELERIEEILIGAADVARPCAITSVQGMPGVGKSYLAYEFIGRRGNRFSGGVELLVLDRDDPRDANALRDFLCDRLKLRAPDPETGWTILRERLLMPPTLLLIENVDAQPQAEAVGKLVRQLSGCRVLITGRFQGLGESNGWEQVPLRPFSADDALKQLIAEYRKPANKAEESEWKAFIATLGHLPLAIHLAAGYLRRPATTCNGFLRRMREKGWREGPIDPADPLTSDRAKGIISVAFDISLNALKRVFEGRTESFIDGFHRLAWAPSTGFGASLGAALAGLDEGNFEDLSLEACRLSLLEFEKEPDGSYRFRIHPLLAELLQPNEDLAFKAVTQWLVERFEDQERWNEIHAEYTSLVKWLGQIVDDQRNRKASIRAMIDLRVKAHDFATLCGPFHLWAAFCEKALEHDLDDSARSDCLWTLSQVAFRAGNLGRAMEAAQEQKQIDQKRGAERDAAMAAGLIADILWARGEMNEAMRIRREEQLPVYERLGDVRTRAFTMGKIADILKARGDLDEAMRLLRDEVLPAFERLGDVRARAVTMGNIADILQARGDLDEAMRIRREEQLPVYERLGDVRARAVTMGKIADILQARGELDEAMRIRREEELPVYERLGDVRELLVCRAKLAATLVNRYAPGDMEEADALLQQALAAARKLKLPREEKAIQRIINTIPKA